MEKKKESRRKRGVSGTRSATRSYLLPFGGDRDRIAQQSVNNGRVELLIARRAFVRPRDPRDEQSDEYRR